MRSCRDLGGHEVVGHVGRGRARPRREDEGVRRVVLRGVDDFERAGEVVVGLAREPDDDVGGDREVVDGVARGREPREVPLGGVAAVHARQRAVTPRLQRQVQVLAHRRALGHRRDGLGTEVFRVRRREADAAQAVDRIERAQEVGELRAVLPGAEIAPVRVDVLAEQRDLAHAVGDELLDLVHDVTHAPADLGATHDGHDAERARVVAPHLDGDPRRVGGVASGGQGRRIRLVLFEDLDDGALGARPGEQCRRVGEVVGAEHDVDVPRALRR